MLILIVPCVLLLDEVFVSAELIIDAVGEVSAVK
jgi:hypothetical protein